MKTTYAVILAIAIMFIPCSMNALQIDGYLMETNDFIIHPDMKRIAVARIAENSVGIYDLNGKLLRMLPGMDMPVTTLAYAPDGKILATGSADNTVNLWTENGTLLQNLKEHSRGVTNIAFSPDGKFILTASYISGDVILWSGDGNRFALKAKLNEKKDQFNCSCYAGLEAPFSCHVKLLFRNDGHFSAFRIWGNKLVTFNAGGKILNRETIPGFDYDISFTRDHSSFIGERFNEKTQKTRLVMASLKTAKVLHSFEKEFSCVSNWGHPFTCNRTYLLSPDGTKVLSSETADLWSIKGKYLRNCSPVKDASTESIYGSRWFSDSKRIAIRTEAGNSETMLSENRITIIDTESGKVLSTFRID